MGIVSTLREFWQLAKDIATSLGIPVSYINGAVALFFIGIVLVLVIHQLPKLLNSLTTIGNNNLKKKEQALENKFIDEDIKYLIRENLQLAHGKKMTGLRANSLFMLKKYTQLLAASQGEISQTQLKKAQSYLIIKDKKLTVNLTKFDTFTKNLGGFMWWVLIMLGLLTCLATFISLSLVDFTQPMSNNEVLKILFWPLMSVTLFMMGFVFLKMYQEVIAAEKIRDFITKYPNWDTE